MSGCKTKAYLILLIFMILSTTKPKFCFCGAQKCYIPSIPCLHFGVGAVKNDPLSPFSLSTFKSDLLTLCCPSVLCLKERYGQRCSQLRIELIVSGRRHCKFLFCVHGK